MEIYTKFGENHKSFLRIVKKFIIYILFVKVKVVKIQNGIYFAV